MGKTRANFAGQITFLFAPGTFFERVSDSVIESVILSNDEPSASISGRERFLAACRCERVDRVPVWLMRQAGRALPEYRKLKESHTFVEMVRTPELAAEVTLQPVLRFGFDAAILFSDILVVPEAMGQGYFFREAGGGIGMEFPIRTAEDIRRLDADGAVDRLQYVADALGLVRPALAGRSALLGFAGSPWTLARYMVEGGSAGDSDRVKALFYNEPGLFCELLEKLTSVVAGFLRMQVEAGAEAVQIFDSNGDVLADDAFPAASGQWIGQIIDSLEGLVPVIVFSKGGAGRLARLAATGANVLSVDGTQPLADVRRMLPENVGVQGNLDPFLLTTTPEIVARETTRILDEMAGLRGHVFNLGHGVTPNARIDCIEALVETVRGWKGAA